MALFPPTVDYTSRDQRTLRLRLQGLARSVFPEWTDYNRSNSGNVILEGEAFVGDVVAHYQDRQAREAFWPTVTQRVNAIRLGRQTSFVMPSATSARTTLRFSLPSPAVKRVPILEGTRARVPSADGPRFRTTEEAEILVGQTQVDVPAEQAILVSDEVFASTGAPNQQFITAQNPVIDNTFVIIADDGEYLQVTSFLDRDPVTDGLIDQASRVFVVLPDPFDRGVILFGTGLVGKIPEGSILVSYKIGGGVIGNVETGQVKRLEDQILDVDGGVVQISVTNVIPGDGGSNRMSVLEARVRAPAARRTTNRSVTKDDYENAARRINGVARAAMITSNEDASVQENEGVIVVVAKGAQLPSGRIQPATPSQQTLDAILEEVENEQPPTLTFTLTAQAAPFFTVNVATRVYLAQGFTTPTVGTNVRNAIKDFFAAQLETGVDNPTIDFGANIKQVDGTVISEIIWSDLFNAIRDTDGVRKVDEGTQGLLLNGLRQSVSLNPRDFPVVGTISIVDADTGLAL